MPQALSSDMDRGAARGWRSADCCAAIHSRAAGSIPCRNAVTKLRNGSGRDITEWNSERLMDELAPGILLYFLLILFPAAFVHLLLPILVSVKRVFPGVLERFIGGAGAYFSGTTGRVGILVYDAFALLFILRFALRQLELAGVN